MVLGGALLGSASALAQGSLDVSGAPRAVDPVAAFVYFGALVLTVRLHRETRGPVAVGAALLPTLGLAGLGLSVLLPDASSPRWMNHLPGRAAFALAAMLPLLLFLGGRWSRGVGPFGPAWRWDGLLFLVALLLAIAGVAGAERCDATAYGVADRELGEGGPEAGDLLARYLVRLLGAMLSGLAQDGPLGLAPELLTQRMQQGYAPTPTGAEEAARHAELDHFMASDRVATAVKAEARAACGSRMEAHPASAHACIRCLVRRREDELSREADRWLALGFLAFPAGILGVLRRRRPLK